MLKVERVRRREREGKEKERKGGRERRRRKGESNGGRKEERRKDGGRRGGGGKERGREEGIYHTRTCIYKVLLLSIYSFPSCVPLPHGLGMRLDFWLLTLQTPFNNV